MPADPVRPSAPAGAPAPSAPPASASFRERVGIVVRAIPHGRVATYGRVARWAGAPRAARQVGAALRGLGRQEGDPQQGAQELPWWRVVNAAGELSTRKLGLGELQAALLRAEGVPVADGRVPLASRLWEGPGEPGADDGAGGGGAGGAAP